MSDLINRQDAIEYFMINTNWHDEDGYTIEDADEKRKLLTDYFNGVPSADAEMNSKLFRIGEVLVEVSKEHITAEQGVKKIGVIMRGYDI